MSKKSHYNVLIFSSLNTNPAELKVIPEWVSALKMNKVPTSAISKENAEAALIKEIAKWTLFNDTPICGSANILISSFIFAKVMSSSHKNPMKNDEIITSLLNCLAMTYALSPRKYLKSSIDRKTANHLKQVIHKCLHGTVYDKTQWILQNGHDYFPTFVKQLHEFESELRDKLREKGIIGKLTYGYYKTRLSRRERLWAALRLLYSRRYFDPALRKFRKIYKKLNNSILNEHWKWLVSAPSIILNGSVPYLDLGESIRRGFGVPSIKAGVAEEKLRPVYSLNLAATLRNNFQLNEMRRIPNPTNEYWIDYSERGIWVMLWSILNTLKDNKFQWFLEIDMSKFFDTVLIENLQRELERRGHYEASLRSEGLHAKCIIDDDLRPEYFTDKAVNQGGASAPRSCSWYLMSIASELSDENHYVRQYVDDLLIMGKVGTPDDWLAKWRQVLEGTNLRFKEVSRGKYGIDTIHIPGYKLKFETNQIHWEIFNRRSPDGKYTSDNNYLLVCKKFSRFEGNFQI